MLNNDKDSKDGYTPSAVLTAILNVTAKELCLPRDEIGPQKRIVRDLGVTMDRLLKLIEKIGERWGVDLCGSERKLLAGAERLEDITVNDVYTELCSALEELGARPYSEVTSRDDLRLEEDELRWKKPEIGEIKYVKPTITEDRVLRLAKKKRRRRSFYQVCVEQPLPVVGAFIFLLFPITYPLYLWLSKPRRLRRLVLALWPFYEVEVQIVSHTLQTIDVCVEGITNGLGSIYLSQDRATTHPYVAVPGKDLGMTYRARKGVMPSTKLIEMTRIPHSLSPKDVADYLLQGAADAARGAKTRSAIRFRHGLEMRDEEVLQVADFKVKNATAFYYPLYVATYVQENVTKCLAFAAMKGSQFHLENLTKPVMTNPLLSSLGVKDKD